MSSNRNRPVKIARIIGQIGCLFSIFSANAATLEVHIDNRQGPGTIYAALHAGPAADWKSKPVALGSTDSDLLLFEDLEPGRYALQLFQDSNANQWLDMSKRGMPLEPVGLSGNPKPARGRPPASECLFTLEPDGSRIHIQLMHPPAARQR